MESDNTLRRILRNDVLIGGAFFVPALATAALFGYDQTGSTQTIHNAVDAVAHDGNQPVIISANMHNDLSSKIPEVARMVDHEKPMVVMMQEVDKIALNGLRHTFPKWDIAFVSGDDRQKVFSAGFGNLIMSKSKLYDVKGISLDQPFLVENRALLLAKTKVKVQGNIFDLQFATGHIGRQPELRKEQIELLVDDLSENVEKGESTIFCGDLNTGSITARRAFDHGAFTTVSPPVKTYIGNARGSIVDHCASYSYGPVGFTKLEIADGLRTDHRPIKAHLVDFNKISPLR